MFVEPVAAIEPRAQGNRIRGCSPRARTAQPTMHVVEIERPVRRKPLPSSATRAAMYPSRA